jgi:hypothetical protein
VRWILILAAAGWLLFVGGAALAGASPGLAVSQSFSRHYFEIFFSLAIFLVALQVALIAAATFYVVRSEIGLAYALLAITCFALLNFMGLRLVRPFFVSAFPG